MNKQIFKKWWFWLALVLILGGIGAATQSGNPTNTEQAQTNDNGVTSINLPTLAESQYLDKEGLIVYKELKGKGYAVSAEFDNTTLTDINGKASDVFEPLDPNDTEDRQSVDAFIVSGLSQDDKNVSLNIRLKSN